jgi:hypothetical protein
MTFLEKNLLTSNQKESGTLAKEYLKGFLLDESNGSFRVEALVDVSDQDLIRKLAESVIDEGSETGVSTTRGA